MIDEVTRSGDDEPVVSVQDGEEVSAFDLCRELRSSYGNTATVPAPNS